MYVCARVRPTLSAFLFSRARIDRRVGDELIYVFLLLLSPHHKRARGIRADLLPLASRAHKRGSLQSIARAPLE